LKCVPQLKDISAHEQSIIWCVETKRLTPI
jgi:hypothetical protein